MSHENRDELLPQLPRALPSPSAFEILINPRNQFKIKRSQFQRGFSVPLPHSPKMDHFITPIKVTKVTFQLVH